jgi:hypothetical protein
MLSPDSPQKKLAEEVSDWLGKEKPFDAAKAVLRFSGQPENVETKEAAYTVLNSFLHWLLNNNGREEAALLLWGISQFDPRPKSTKRVWKAADTHNCILLMGAGSMSKSFSMAIWLFLEWIRDPEYTTVKVLGPSERHLEDNLFTHLIQLHKDSRIPLPGTVGKLFIGLNLRQRKSSITGVVIPLGKKAAGRLQGVKRHPRKKAHPIFGKTSRLFIFLDEIANIPVGIWRDIDNLLSNTQGDGLKIVGAFNPTDQNDPVGQRCEPPFGWPGFDPDSHYEWQSTRGWFVVRLDAAQCENVLTGKVIFEGLQTKEGFDLIIQNSGGMNSPNYWSMARGCFPPMGTVMAIIPQGMLDGWKADVIWYDTPEACGGVDLALEGSDSARFAKGLFGRASGLKYMPTLLNPAGKTVYFEDKKGRKVPRNLLWLEQIFNLPKGDTVAMQKEITRLCQAMRIKPEWLAVDRTGNGQGVFDLLKFNWGGGVVGVNLSEGATNMRIMAEDTGTAEELYDRVTSELWFATRKFIEFKYFFASPGLPMEELLPQLTSRLFRATGKKASVESKPAWKSRNQNKSPDEADAVTLLVHAARKASSFVPGMLSENSTNDGEDDWDDDDMSGPRVDVTNLFADLETP